MPTAGITLKLLHPHKSPRPTQKKFQFYNRPTVHGRFQSVTPQQTPSKPTARHHMSLPNKKHRISVRVVQPRPFDTVALSRTHPQPSEITTRPNHPMKRFKKKALNHQHKNLNNTTPSPSVRRPNKKPRK